MKQVLPILIFISLFTCNDSKTKSQIKKKLVEQTRDCNYIDFFKNLGNTKMDTIRIGQNLIDPIDDVAVFKKTMFDFVTRGNEILKKSKTHRQCDGKFINVEYYQDFSKRIDLSSYKEFDNTYFASKSKVYFWWTNSDGHLMIPINGADPKTFKPFENICGGTDKKRIYYGSPNKGVHQLNIPTNSKYEFIAKKDNYWNTPKHYVIVDKKVFDIKYDIEKGYFCELNKNISIADIKNE